MKINYNLQLKIYGYYQPEEFQNGIEERFHIEEVKFNSVNLIDYFTPNELIELEETILNQPKHDN